MVDENAVGMDLRWPASAIWRPGEPTVHMIGLADLRDALHKGIDRFQSGSKPRDLPLHNLSRYRSHFVQALVWLRHVAAGLPAHRRVLPDRPICIHRPVRAEPTPRKGSRCLCMARSGRSSISVNRCHRQVGLRATGDILRLAGCGPAHVHADHGRRGASFS